ncbi:unnamed protein product [Symbiodinium sp. KB8]|nr:unnamed protein product [Symbiodinium sp. KB8]
MGSASSHEDLARVEQNAMPVPFEKDMVDKESISSPLTHESRFLPWGRVPFPDLTEHLENAAPQLLQHSGNAEAAMGELRKAVNQALQESSSRSRPSPGVALPQLQGDFAEASPDSRSRPRGAGLLPSPPHEVTGGSSRMGRITL